MRGEVTRDPTFPHCNCTIRDPQSYVWHDSDFVTPNFFDMIVYQLHVGAFGSSGVMGTFLDVVEKIEYLAALGVNVIQLLPIDEVETVPSLGYNGADYFSPDTSYVEYDKDKLGSHLDTINLSSADSRSPIFGLFYPFARRRALSVSPELDDFFLAERHAGDRWPAVDRAIELWGRWRQHPASASACVKAGTATPQPGWHQVYLTQPFAIRLLFASKPQRRTFPTFEGA